MKLSEEKLDQIWDDIRPDSSRKLIIALALGLAGGYLTARSKQNQPANLLLSLVNVFKNTKLLKILGGILLITPICLTRVLSLILKKMKPTSWASKNVQLDMKDGERTIRQVTLGNADEGEELIRLPIKEGKFLISPCVGEVAIEA